MRPLTIDRSSLYAEIGRRGRRSFYEFCRLAWPTVEQRPLVNSWYVRVVCDHLEAVWRGDPRQTVINIPPGFAKSTITCAMWPVWIWLQDPTAQILSVSYDGKLTRRDAAKGLALIQSQWFRERFGGDVVVPKDAGATEYHNTAGGVRYTASVGSKVTGKHPDVVIIDDPIKPRDVTPAGLEAAEDFWRYTLSTRARDPMTVRRVCVMQRLHQRDLSALFESLGWHMLRLPMRYEPEHAHPKDPRTTPGELLAPERADEASVLALEAALGPIGRAAQLQQRPSPEEGNIIRNEWIRWYEPTELPESFDRVITSWDLAFKATATSDFVAGQVWGVSVSRFYLIDGMLERLDFAATIQAMLRTIARHPAAMAHLVEDKANGPAVMSVLEDKVSGIIAVDPQGGKVARLNAVQPLFEAGNVYLPEGSRVAEELAANLTAFPQAAHDDDVDACSQALSYLRTSVTDYSGVVATLRAAGLLPRQ